MWQNRKKQQTIFHAWTDFPLRHTNQISFLSHHDHTSLTACLTKKGWWKISSLFANKIKHQKKESKKGREIQFQTSFLFSLYSLLVYQGQVYTKKPQKVSSPLTSHPFLHRIFPLLRLHNQYFFKIVKNKGNKVKWVPFAIIVKKIFQCRWKTVDRESTQRNVFMCRVNVIIEDSEWIGFFGGWWNVEWRRMEKMLVLFHFRQ